MPRNYGTVLEADSLLSGTFELFPLAEVLGLIERAAVSGVLVVRGREVDGSLYFVDGALCAGEIGDLSGPVEGQQALEIRLLEVAVPLLRTRGADFEFRARRHAAVAGAARGPGRRPCSSRPAGSPASGRRS